MSSNRDSDTLPPAQQLLFLLRDLHHPTEGLTPEQSAPFEEITQKLRDVNAENNNILTEPAVDCGYDPSGPMGPVGMLRVLWWVLNDRHGMLWPLVTPLGRAEQEFLQGRDIQRLIDAVKEAKEGSGGAAMGRERGGWAPASPKGGPPDGSGSSGNSIASAPGQ